MGIWCVLGNIADVQPGFLRVGDDAAICYIDQAHASKPSVGDTVGAAGVTGSVVKIDEQPLPASELTDDERSIIKSSSSWAACAVVAIDMPQGDYAADVTVEEYRPLDLLLNRS